MAQLAKLPMDMPFTPPRASARPNILLVDDRKENLLATEKVLKNLDAGIYKATSGNEALSLMLRYRFAVVLLDVQMPEMDGFEVAMLMQEHRSEIASLVARETGKSMKDALGETDAAIEMGFFVAGEGRRFYGQTTTSAVPNSRD